tara:strand:+ start:432 stop:686 length:255 start_codon:yes stop_codon:yes gene_type:complete
MENTFEKWPTINWDDNSDQMPPRENLALSKLKTKTTPAENEMIKKELVPRLSAFEQTQGFHKETLGAINSTNELLRELIDIIKS